ncbi:MAG: 4-hydroxy-tetrahydrodipicolinate reductase [Chthonomonadales bacterium]
MSIRVAVVGASGRMGREVVKAVLGADGIELVATVDVVNIGEEAGSLSGLAACGVFVEESLETALARGNVDALVDFTIPTSAMANIETSVRHKVPAVVGTTGLTPADVETIRGWSAEFGTPVFIAPNFAIGAVLMMQFSQQAAKYLPNVEIIEIHHERKLDSPSGTALRTAELIRDSRESSPLPSPANPIEKVAGARGAEFGEVHIHSVRLPGHVAHQQVIFGGTGETLTIRHDSFDRVSFMPGVIVAVRKVRDLTGVVIGMENIL